MSRRALGFLAIAVIAAFALSLVAGKVWLPLSAWTGADPRSPIIAELRLPRAVLAAAIGAGLGVSGAAMQGYLRNPLADPGLFGVSAGAALGAVVSLFLRLCGVGVAVADLRAGRCGCGDAAPCAHRRSIGQLSWCSRSRE